MMRVLERSQHGIKPLEPDERAALEAALKYFDVAAPRHTQDEEESLFPRLRDSNDPAAHAALAQVQRLEEDHRHADAMHGEVKTLCRQWLDSGPLSAADVQRLDELLHGLQQMYARHIALEDKELFPLAAQVLNRRQLDEMGQEMAKRRGLAMPQS
jgi:hemerythrin-like domain-containing protein